MMKKQKEEKNFSLNFLSFHLFLEFRELEVYTTLRFSETTTLHAERHTHTQLINSVLNFSIQQKGKNNKKKKQQKII